MQNKVVIITGGTSGIGLALAQVWGRQGAQVVITGRNANKLAEAKDQLMQQGYKVLALQADASREEDSQRMVEETIRQFGKLDVLICNAGISMRALFEDVKLEVFRQVMDIKFWGTVYATKFALPHLLKSKGAIIGISSINGRRGTPARTAYTAANYAIEGFFESLRTEVMKRGVKVLVVCPGFTASNIRNAALTADGTPQGKSPRDERRMMSAEAVAEATYDALQKGKRDLVLTTEGKVGVFLNKWIPGIMDRLVYNKMAKEPDSPLRS
jgi:NAD(P)-dependent dehydrogenase (short-subunit alcohol dehydrogenase family)